MVNHIREARSKSLNYLRTHSSTSKYTVNTIGDFFHYIKDIIISIVNADHKFKVLKDQSIPEFNLISVKKDLEGFIKNQSLLYGDEYNRLKNMSVNTQYPFKYEAQKSYILPDFYHIYNSGTVEPNDLITQLINYVEKYKDDKITESEKHYKNGVISALTAVSAGLEGYKDRTKESDLQKLIDKISAVTNI